VKIISTFIVCLLSSSYLCSAKAPLSVIRVNSTKQNYNITQPWEKSAPHKRRALGAILENNRVLTTAEVVANATFLELETVDGEDRATAKVLHVDNEANLALLEPLQGDDILSESKPLSISGPAMLGSSVDVWQVESTGMPIVTKGTLQSTNMISSFLEGHFFLTYEIKASMQSASSSFSLPVLKDDKLLGLLTSYDSDDQILDVIAPEIIANFLEDAADGNYEGFPSLGVGAARTSDPHLRAWLKLSEDEGGVYVINLANGGSAEKAGLQLGDVILSVEGKKLSQKGFYDSEIYQQIYWSHLIRGEGKVNKPVEIVVKRGEENITYSIELQRPKQGLVPTDTIGFAPRYLIKGGLIFQELTKSYLEAYGDKWESKAPLNLLDAYTHPEDYEQNTDRIVFLSSVIPTPATVGYEFVNSAIIEKVNGISIRDIPSLIKAFESPELDSIHTIELDSAPHKIYVDAQLSDKVDHQLKQRGLSSLSRE